MTTCIATVEPRAKVAHTALLHECARYFADDRCWCTIGPRTLGASGSGDVARRTVCTADARACDQLARHRDPRKRLRGRGDQAARALWSTCGPLTVFRAVQASYRAYLPRVPTDVRRTLVRRSSCCPDAPTTTFASLPRLYQLVRDRTTPLRSCARRALHGRVLERRGRRGDGCRRQ